MALKALLRRLLLRAQALRTASNDDPDRSERAAEVADAPTESEAQQTPGSAAGGGDRPRAETGSAGAALLGASQQVGVLWSDWAARATRQHQAAHPCSPGPRPRPTTAPPEAEGPAPQQLLAQLDGLKRQIHHLQAGLATRQSQLSQVQEQLDGQMRVLQRLGREALSGAIYELTLDATLSEKEAQAGELELHLTSQRHTLARFARELDEQQAYLASLRQRGPAGQRVLTALRAKLQLIESRSAVVDQHVRTLQPLAAEAEARARWLSARSDPERRGADLRPEGLDEAESDQLQTALESCRGRVAARLAELERGADVRPETPLGRNALRRSTGARMPLFPALREELSLRRKLIGALRELLHDVREELATTNCPLRGTEASLHDLRLDLARRTRELTDLAWCLDEHQNKLLEAEALSCEREARARLSTAPETRDDRCLRELLRAAATACRLRKRALVQTLERRQRTIDELHAQRAALARTIGALRAEIHKREARIDHVTRECARRDVRITQLERALEEQARLTRESADRASRGRAEIERARNKLSQAASRRARHLVHELGELDALDTLLRDMLAATQRLRDEHVLATRLLTALEAASKRLGDSTESTHLSYVPRPGENDLRDALRDREEELEALQAELRQWRDQYAALEQALHEREQRIAALETRLGERDRTLDALRLEVKRAMKTAEYHLNRWQPISTEEERQGDWSAAAPGEPPEAPSGPATQPVRH